MLILSPIETEFFDLNHPVYRVVQIKKTTGAMLNALFFLGRKPFYYREIEAMKEVDIVGKKRF